jgi:lipoprotein-anchoring transpeptidase ErfK/SrfK
VFYRSHHPAGTIVIETNERHLYLIESETRALRYGIGVGRDGFTWAGLLQITHKAEWPDWHPPPEMIARQPYLPRFMAGGPGIPWALARCIWETPFIASMAPTRRRPSATQFRPAVFV